mmetsp:Transcript_40701/g.122590  ORF Transcript_40701/g.122590 Transcript_40701/m.122590 type:complete len:91 (-) Transcript_40701:1443-1715(-)
MKILKGVTLVQRRVEDCMNAVEGGVAGLVVKRKTRMMWVVKVPNMMVGLTMAKMTVSSYMLNVKMNLRAYALGKINAGIDGKVRGGVGLV